jgi:hypothetical protein
MCSVHGLTGSHLCQDFPRRLSPDSEYTETRFEQILRKHVKELGCPDDFQNIYLTPGVFDFSAAKVYLVTSKPGSYCGDEATEYGQLRLRRIVRKKILKNYTEANLPKMSFEMYVMPMLRLTDVYILLDVSDRLATSKTKTL